MVPSTWLNFVSQEFLEDADNRMRTNCFGIDRASDSSIWTYVYYGSENVH